MASFHETSIPKGVAVTSSTGPKLPVFLIILLTILVPALLAYSLASGNETQVVAFILAILGALVIIARPFWGLILFVGLLYTRPEENIPALAGAHLPLIISLVTMFALIFQKLLNREAAVKTPLNGMIIGFGIAVVLSSFVSGTTSTAIQDIGRLVILVLLILNLANSPERYRILVDAVLLFTGYLAAYSIYLYFTGGALVENGTLLRSQATGIFSDPNDLAATIVAGLGFSLVRIRQSVRIVPRLSYAGVSGLLIAAILLTESRGGMLAIIVVIVIFAFRASRNKPLAMTLALIVVVGLFAAKGGHMTNFDSGEDSANSRFWFWSNGVEQLISHPLLGVGYNGFPDVNGGMTAHNSFVLCFAETGLLGYFFWIGCLYYALQQNTYKKLTLENDIQMDSVVWWDALGCHLAIIAYVTASFFLSHTYNPIFYVLLSLSVAHQIGHLKDSGESVSEKKINNRDVWKILTIEVLSISLIYGLSMQMR